MEPVPPSPELQSVTGSGCERVKVLQGEKEECKVPSRRRHKQREINPNFRANQEGKYICKSCDKSFVNVHSAKRHFKYYCPKGEKLPPPTPPSAGSLMTCAYCSYKCAASNCQELMRLHLARLHPEMFFVSERNSPCLSLWKMEHFKDIVVDIVFPRFLLRNGVSFTCSVCSKMYGRGDRFTRNRYQSTTHLIYHHTQEVREYLKDILKQSDAFLKGKLDNKRKEKSESSICDDEMDEALNKSFCLSTTESFPSTPCEKQDQKFEFSDDSIILSPTYNELRSPSADLFMLTCAYCSFECANTPDAMERHLMLRHPETFFLNQRNSSLSRWKNEHFKDIVIEIAFPKFILTNEFSTSCLCSGCGKKYSKCKNITLNSNLLTVHLLSEHLQEVRDYLKGVLGQSDAALREKLDRIRNSQKSIASMKVEDCSSSSSKDTSELETSAPEFFSSSDPNPEKLEIEDKPLSPPPEQLQSTRTRERIRISVGQKRKKDSDSDFPLSPSTKTKRAKVMCKFCNKSFAHLQSAQRHWMHSCPKRNLPNTDSMLSCAYCKYECAKGELMKKHLVRLHPEMFFLSERDAFLSRWKNCEQIFKIIVTEIAFPKFIRTNGISSLCSCSICGREFSTEEGVARDRFYLKTHLVNDHIQVVREYIKDILGQFDDGDDDEASLQEKLCYLLETKCEGKQVEVIPSSGRSKHICEFCNKEFVSASILKRHLNKYCKSKKGKIVSSSDADSSVLTCAYCSYVCISRPVHMKRHLVRQHPEMFFLSDTEGNDSSLSSSSPWKNEHFKRIVMEILFPEFILTDGISISCSCSVCGKIYENGRSIGENRSMMTLHLIDDHIQRVREHLEGIMGQSDKSLQKQLDNMRKRKSIDELMRIFPT